MNGPAIASRVVGTIRMTADSQRGRLVRKNVMIALTKAQCEQIFPVWAATGSPGWLAADAKERSKKSCRASVYRLRLGQCRMKESRDGQDPIVAGRQSHISRTAGAGDIWLDNASRTRRYTAMPCS